MNQKNKSTLSAFLLNNKELILFLDDNGHIKIVLISDLKYLNQINELIRRYIK